jgi:hypothetical protein
MNFLARSVTVAGSTGRLDLTLQTNTINGITFAGVVNSGIMAVSGSSTGTHAQTVCLNATTNTVNGTNGDFVWSATMRQRTGTTFQLQGFAGDGTSTLAVENFVFGNNPNLNVLATGESDGNERVDVFDPSGSTIINYTGAACNAPVAPSTP